MSTAYLGLGSNLGDRAANLRAALDLLSRTMKVERVSSIYETEPWGYRGQPCFLNAVARVSTDLSPRDLLVAAKGIEASLGRTATFRYGPRAIDIDILLYENEVVEEPDLGIPHPRLLERAFVLAPMAEIAPELVHPGEGKTMKELASKVKGKETVKPWKGPDAHPCKVCRGEVKTNIRPLAADDYEQVWRLWHTCKFPVGGFFERTAVERITQHDPELSLVAEVNGVVIGAVVGYLHGNHGRVMNHCVDPLCRGRGIGNSLFKEVEQKLLAKGATEVEAMVPSGSLEGKKFFEDAGFVEDGRYTFMVKQYGGRRQERGERSAFSCERSGPHPDPVRGERDV